MRQNPASGIQVIKKEDKEATLRAFILQDLEDRKSGLINDHREYLVLARCFDSPVIGAVVGLRAKIIGAGVRVRSIVSTINVLETYALFGSSGAVLTSGGIRLAADQRLFDAHEQLVLNDRTCWIGDVVRRHPAKRDAYERFCHDDEKSVGWTTAAFERIWAASVDPAPRGRHAVKASMGDELERKLAMSPKPNNGEVGPIAGTRH